MLTVLPEPRLVSIVTLALDVTPKSVWNCFFLLNLLESSCFQRAGRAELSHSSVSLEQEAEKSEAAAHRVRGCESELSHSSTEGSLSRFGLTTCP